MRTYRVIAKRTPSRYWELHINGVGVTQARNLREAEPMVVDYICTALNVAEGSFGVQVVPYVDDALLDEVALAKRLLSEAEEAVTKAARGSREVVSHLKEAGLPQRDIAVVLGLSQQRVSQLAKSQG